MERVSQRESFLINLAAERRSDDSPSSSTSVPRRRRISSDFDFNDVFGGPPRRFSVHNSDEAVSTEDGLSVRSFSSEKPVFGEESIVSRRKNHQSNDFFDDIYRGGDKSCSSPGKSFVSSLPGSRIMSPSRPLPPKLEPTGTSLPAQFSLPATVMNVMDYPTFTSSSSSKKKEGTSIGRSSSSYQISRFSSQTLMQEQDHYRSDVWSSSHPSSLSNEFSPRKEESTYTAVSNETEKTRNFNDTSKSTEAPVYSDEFHFSIYKWPRYEIPVMIPLHQRIKLKSKENDLNKSSNAIGSGNEDTVIGLLPSNVCHVDTPNISVNLESSRMEVEELGEANTSFISRPTTVDTISSYKTEDTKRNSVNDTSFTKETKKEATVFAEEVHKPELKRMHSIIRDGFDQQGRGDTTVKVEGKDNVVKTAKLSDSNAGASEVVKEYEVKKVGSHRKEVNKARTQGSPIYFSENPKRSGARGKVKEFAKLFNQDSSSKAKIKGEGPTQSGRWEGKVDGAKVSNIRVGPASTYKLDSEMHLPSDNKLPDASFVREKHHLPEKPTIHISTDKSSDNKEPDPLSAGLTPESPKLAADEDIDDLSQINYMIEELCDDQVKLSVVTEDQETTKTLDAKIHKWSTGKKGNIRSLLSTLQYVLWAESGWKPVPLVNIIEGNGVKKAYQRAMLCLHPDKLQQKGASPHQKYTAEKVFNILQEAWDQFNLLGST